MKGSVGEPHSDQRDHPLDARVSDDFVRGHRLWTAVKARGRRSTITAALVCTVSTPRRVARRAPRRTSSPCFHNAYSTCASLRASAMMATWTPRRVAICLAHCTIGSLRPTEVHRPRGLSQSPAHLRGARAGESCALGPKAGRVLPGDRGRDTTRRSRHWETARRHRARRRTAPRSPGRHRHGHQPPHADVFVR